MQHYKSAKLYENVSIIWFYSKKVFLFLSIFFKHVGNLNPIYRLCDIVVFSYVVKIHKIVVTTPHECSNTFALVDLSLSFFQGNLMDASLHSWIHL
jgi:hypothetical protein